MPRLRVMTITAAQLDFLTSDAGIHLLDQLSHEDLGEANTLPLLTRLRRDHSGDEAGAALALARLRLAAVGKFGADASRMFFTREALEQSSDPLIRRWRAAIVGAQATADVCCGIGSDALAFAQAGADVHGLDIDPVRVALAGLNAVALNVRSTFEVADARNGVPNRDFIFFDPARRTESGRRIYDVEAYQPPLSLAHTWGASSICVKLSPGVDKAQLGEFAEGWRLDFISANGDLKEANLWRMEQPGSSLRAILLTEDETYTWDNLGLHPDVPLREPQGWLCEPDPALIRAELVQDVAAMHQGALLDETIAYFTTEHKSESPWLRAWPIEAWMPFNLKRLREYLRAQDVGRVTVKKRGTAVTPDVLIPKLKLKGSNERVIVLTRLRGQQIAMVCLPA
ncbi:MAG: methyltransferase domain-containing protein [Anaerolineae bacterium]|nr:methyltransferase domain-containing protein [Anaerolineae bacterium]